MFLFWLRGVCFPFILRAFLSTAAYRPVPVRDSGVLNLSETRCICDLFIVMTNTSGGVSWHVLRTVLQAFSLLLVRLRASQVLSSSAATVQRMPQVLTVRTTTALIMCAM